MRQLKELGLYDSTGIVILADHGNNEESDADHQPIYLIKMPGERHENMEVRHVPVTIQDCFIPDVLSMENDEGISQGIPSAKTADEPTERWMRIYAYDDSYPPLPGASYNVMHEYRYRGDGADLIGRWLSGDYLTVPMADSFY